MSKKGYHFRHAVTYLGENNTPTKTQRKTGLLQTFSIAAFLLGIALIYLILIRTDPVQNDEVFSGQLKEHFLTYDEHIQRRPRISHDGQYIVYIQQHKSIKHQQSIYLYNTNTNTHTHLLEENARRLAVTFAAENNSLLVVRKESDSGCEIYFLSIFERSKNTFIGCDQSSLLSIDWSSKTNQLITTEYDSRKKNTYIVAINIDSKLKTTIGARGDYSLYFPRISPDGRFVVARVDNKSTRASRIALINIADNSTEVLDLALSSIGQVNWSQSSQSVYILSSTGPKKGIWHFDIVSKALTQVSNGMFSDIDVNDKYQMITAANWQLTYSSTTIDIDETDLTTNNDRGRVIAFRNLEGAGYSAQHQQSFVVSTLDGNKGIWRQHPPNSQFQRIYSKPNQNIYSPFISAEDGQFYFFTDSDNHSTELYTISPKSGSAVSIMTVAHIPEQAQINSRDKAIYFVIPEGTKRTLMKTSINGGTPEKVTTEDVQNFKFIDGKLWALVEKDGSLKIGLLNNKGQLVNQFDQPRIHETTHLGWTVRDDILFYYQRSLQGKFGEIVAIDLHSNQSKVIYSLPHLPVAYSLNLNITNDDKLQLEYLYSEARDILLFR